MKQNRSETQRLDNASEAGLRLMPCAAAENMTIDQQNPQLAQILDALPFYVMLVDSRHNIHFANKAIRDTLRMPMEQLFGEYCPKIVHGCTEPYAGCPLPEAVKGLTFEKEYFDKDRGRWLLSSAYPTGCKTPAGDEIFFHSVRDISGKKRAEEDLFESERKYRTLFEEIRDVVFIASPAGQLVDINQAGLEFMELSADDFQAMNIFTDLNLKSGDWTVFNRSLTQNSYVQDYEVSFIKKNGDVAYASITAGVERGEDGDISSVRGIMRDLTRHRELEYQSTTDDLTSLYNHGFFQTYLSNRIRQLRANKHQLTILFLDIDDFKAYNDEFGHQEGDQILKKVAQIIMQAARGEDIAARYGGEEFTLILDCDFRTATAVAERLRRSIELQCSPGADPKIRRAITVSIGVASLGMDAREADNLIKIADARMYEAKKLGKNQVYSGNVSVPGAHL